MFKYTTKWEKIVLNLKNKIIIWKNKGILI